MAVMAETAAPGCTVDCIGIRPGEKLHEVLVSEDEARNTLEYEDMYIVRPPSPWYFGDLWQDGRPLADGFWYGSNNNPLQLDAAQIHQMVELCAGARANGATPE
jgi:UDP-N-acetylglucosamine 4,6-dehydratase